MLSLSLSLSYGTDGLHQDTSGIGSGGVGGIKARAGFEEDNVEGGGKHCSEALGWSHFADLDAFFLVYHVCGTGGGGAWSQWGRGGRTVDIGDLTVLS